MAWVYEISRGRWNENGDADYLYSGDRASSRDQPRYTDQRVYEEEAGFPFKFGGNPWGNWEQERQAEARGLLAPWSAAPAEHWPPARPRHGDQEDTVPGEVLRPHGGPGLPQYRGQQLRKPRGQGGAAGVQGPGQPGVSEENIICDHLVPVKVMIQMILNSNAISDFLLLRCLMRLVSTDPFANLSQILPERPCRGS